MCAWRTHAPAHLYCRNLKRYLHYLTRYEANLHKPEKEEELRKVRRGAAGQRHGQQRRSQWGRVRPASSTLRWQGQQKQPEQQHLQRQRQHQHQQL